MDRGEKKRKEKKIDENSENIQTYKQSSFHLLLDEVLAIISGRHVEKSAEQFFK